MSAKPPAVNNPLKISEVMEAFFRLDAGTQQEVWEQVQRLRDPQISEADRAGVEKALAGLLRIVGGGRQGGGVITREERLSPAHRALMAQMEQAEAAFAATLTRLMAERQLTQAQLAERVGVGQSAISMLLKRRCRPQRRTLGKLAEALGVSVEELWPGFHTGWRSGLL